MGSSQPIVMPKLGLTMTEGMLAEWKVSPGDTVKAGDVIFVVETDKISNEIEATADAVVTALHVAAGDTVQVGEVIATFASESPLQGDTGLEAMEPHSPDPAPPEVNVVASEAAPKAAPDDRIIATPLARRLAAAARIDLSSLTGSGPRGRIRAPDVIASKDQTSGEMLPKPASTSPPPNVEIEDRGTVRPFGGYQKVTARRLTEAKREIPHFYVMAEADVTDLLELRKRLNSDGAHAKLTVNHFIITAIARVLFNMPEANIAWTEGGVLELAQVDIGVAVEGPNGLVAPVLKDIGHAAVDEVAASAARMVERVRAGRLSSAELRGGAVTVSNVGMFGATGLIPIVNPGQSSILGVGRNRELFAPDAAGSPVLRQILTLTLSCDHRVIDGALAARFLHQVQRGLEAPLSLLRRLNKEHSRGF